jgi:translation initiation factor IF-2
MHLLEVVRGLFPAVPILVVENKIDLIDSGSDRLKMSATSGQGVPEVMTALLELVKPLEKTDVLF